MKAIGVAVAVVTGLLAYASLRPGREPDGLFVLAGLVGGGLLYAMGSLRGWLAEIADHLSKIRELLQKK